MVASLTGPLESAYAWLVANLAALAADDSDAPCANTNPMFWGELLEPPPGTEEA